MSAKPCGEKSTVSYMGGWTWMNISRMCCNVGATDEKQHEDTELLFLTLFNLQLSPKTILQISFI